ncbi:MAG: thrombospondin type 3 repeat-containing protein [Deltaproteobacteria bacterium]|nr:thrombospondin type 3 repeat-containing protein [Deltaproteobacteria bacterium]
MRQFVCMMGIGLCCLTAACNDQQGSTSPAATPTQSSTPEPQPSNTDPTGSSASGGATTASSSASGSSGDVTTSPSSSGGGGLAVLPQDTDADGVADPDDNCLTTANPNQIDLDGDALGDDCDDDLDGDGVVNMSDHCLLVADPSQSDLDKDGIGDACEGDRDGDGVADAKDNCPQGPNPAQADLDDDNQGDACDADIDWDGLPNATDNCPYVVNVEQQDLDQDGEGDACENDVDGDKQMDAEDNCPNVANADQGNTDGDKFGDACDDDADGDGLVNAADNCAASANAEQVDQDGDALGNACDDDTDGDGALNAADNCPLLVNADQLDSDGNQVGNACEQDQDGDGFNDTLDNCGGLQNADQANADDDAQGDLCDTDDDNDTILDPKDNCPLVANTNQLDVDRLNHDSTKMGDICDSGAVWVGANGGADADGSLAKPFPTLKQAMQAIQVNGKRKLFLLAGTYEAKNALGQALFHNVSFYGGYSYDPATQILTRDVTKTPTVLNGNVIVGNTGGTTYLWGVQITTVVQSGALGALTVWNTADLDALTIQATAEAGDILPSVNGITIVPKQSGTTVTLRNSTITVGEPTQLDGGATGVSVSDFEGHHYTLNGRRNTILVQGSSTSTGLHLLEQAATKQSQLTWRDSVITLTAAQKSATAVEVQGGAAVLLERNRLSVSGAETATGIQLDGVAASMVATNGIFVDNTSAAPNWTTGLDLLHLGQLRVWANTVRVRQGPRVRAVYLESIADGSLYDNILAPADGTEHTAAIAFAPTKFVPVQLVKNLSRPLPVKYCYNDQTGEYAIDDAMIQAKALPFNASGTIVAEPQFDEVYQGVADPFHVGSGSPVINKAYNLLQIGTEWKGPWGAADFRSDLVGHTRPSSGGFDIGAYEVK